MARLLRVSFPEEAIDRYGLQTKGTIEFEDLRRRWAAEEARKALHACQMAATEVGLKGTELGLGDGSDSE